MLGAQNQKPHTYSPTNVGIEQEYWQSLSYLPITAGQEGKARILGWQDTSNAKAWVKLLRRLNRTTRSDPSLLANNKQKALLSGREGGKF